MQQGLDIFQLFCDLVYFVCVSFTLREQLDICKGKHYLGDVLRKQSITLLERSNLTLHATCSRRQRAKAVIFKVCSVFRHS